MSSSPPPDNAPAVDLDALEAKAKAAKNTGLPIGEHEGVPWLIRLGTGPRAVAVAWLDDTNGGTIAEFLAACDPDTVLELIRRVRGLEEAIQEDTANWNFNTLFFVAKALLHHYPENSIVCNETGDPGARFAFHLRKALAALGSPGEGEPAE